jgi:uncharacterized membrane protein
MLKFKKIKFIRTIVLFFSLVLDDTPGAFLLGLVRGTSSLFLNLMDFLLTTLMKLLNAFSWVAHTATLGTFSDFKKRHKYSSSYIGNTFLNVAK